MLSSVTFHWNYYFEFLFVWLPLAFIPFRSQPYYYLYFWRVPQTVEIGVLNKHVYTQTYTHLTYEEQARAGRNMYIHMCVYSRVSGRRAQSFCNDSIINNNYGLIVSSVVFYVSLFALLTRNFADRQRNGHIHTYVYTYVVKIIRAGWLHSLAHSLTISWNYIW